MKSVLKKIILILTLIFFYQCQIFPKKENQIFPKSNQFIWNGFNRTYETYFPENKKIQYLLVALHGRAGTGKEFFIKSEMYSIADREGILLIFPDGENKSWTDGRKLSTDNENLDDKGFILALTKKYQTEFFIPKENLILIGYSNGGYMTEKIAFESNIFNTYITFVSTISLNLSKQQPKFPQNIMLVNGTEDPIVPYSGGEVLGGKGKILSVEESISIWKKRNLCTNEEIVKPKDKFDDGVNVFEIIYKNCKTKKSLKLIRLDGAGHGYPGKLENEIKFGRFTEEISANEEIWKFFKSLKIDTK